MKNQSNSQLVTLHVILERAHKLYENGMQLYRAGELESAQTAFMESHKMGSIDSQCMLGFMYETGAIEYDRAKALHLLEKGASVNHAQSMGYLGMIYCSIPGRRKEGHAILTRAIELGGGDACAIYAFDIERSDKTMPTRMKAFKLYSLGAQKGSVISAVNLAHRYHNGFGCERNKEMAQYWFEVVKSQSSDLSNLMHLGWLYRLGIGTQRNQINAFRLTMISAQAGFRKAFEELGQLYRSGIGCRRSEKEALKWSQKASDKGSRKGAFEVWFADPKRCPEMDSFKLALERNHPEAFLFEAAFAGDRGGEANYRKAKNALQLYVSLGEHDDDSMRLLGLIYKANILTNDENREVMDMMRMQAFVHHEHATQIGDCFRTAELMDRQLSITWDSVALTLESPYACSDLEAVYQHGLAIPTNQTLWMEKCILK